MTDPVDVPETAEQPQAAAPEPAYETVSASTREPKVLAATYGASAAGVVSGFLLYMIDALFFGGFDKGADVPFPIVQIVLLVVPGVMTFAAGYFARHVNR